MHVRGNGLVTDTRGTFLRAYGGIAMSLRNERKFEAIGLESVFRGRVSQASR
jgi:hypothetical protein